MAETRRENLIYAQVISQLATHLHVPPNAATLVILGMLGLVVNHVFACIWYYLGADDFSEECSVGGRAEARLHVDAGARAAPAPHCVELTSMWAPDI